MLGSWKTEHGVWTSCASEFIFMFLCKFVAVFRTDSWIDSNKLLRIIGDHYWKWWIKIWRSLFLKYSRYLYTYFCNSFISFSIEKKMGLIRTMMQSGITCILHEKIVKSNNTFERTFSKGVVWEMVDWEGYIAAIWLSLSRRLC